MIELYQGDALKIMKTLTLASYDAVITDPPYSGGGATLSEKVKIQVRSIQTPRKHAHILNSKGIE